jgi:hypothetical protein
VCIIGMSVRRHRLPTCLAGFLSIGIVVGCGGGSTAAPEPPKTTASTAAAPASRPAAAPAPAPASRPAAAPHQKFTPFVLRGNGPRTLAVLVVPARAWAVADAGSSPIAVSTRNTLLFALGPAERRPVSIPAGRYTAVRVTATGHWSVRIVPARS